MGWRRVLFELGMSCGWSRGNERLECCWRSKISARQSPQVARSAGIVGRGAERPSLGRIAKSPVPKRERGRFLRLRRPRRGPGADDPRAQGLDKRLHRGSIPLHLDPHRAGLVADPAG